MAFLILGARTLLSSSCQIVTFADYAADYSSSDHSHQTGLDMPSHVKTRVECYACDGGVMRSPASCSMHPFLRRRLGFR